jgi:hypothetical protein
MPRTGFEPATPATKRQQTHALDRAATGIGLLHLSSGIIYCRVSCWTYYNIYKAVTGGMSNHYHSTEVLMD